jgi:hypothetical protein
MLTLVICFAASQETTGTGVIGSDNIGGKTILQ